VVPIGGPAGGPASGPVPGAAGPEPDKYARVRKDNAIKIFISHKQEEGEAARKIKGLLEYFGNGRLSCFVSELIAPGRPYPERIEEELRESLWFLFLYTDPQLSWDWCLYEAGMFRGWMEAHDRLTCLYHREAHLPDAISRFQAVKADPEGVEIFVRDLYTKPPLPAVEPSGDGPGIAEMDPINPQIADSQEDFNSLIARLCEAVGSPAPEKERLYHNKYVFLTPKWPIDGEPSWPLKDDEARIELASCAVETDDKTASLFGLSAAPRDATWEELVSHYVNKEDSDRRWLDELEKTLNLACRRLAFQPVFATFRASESGKIYRPMIYRTDFALDGSACECRLVFIDSLTRGASREQPEDLRVLLTSLRLAIRLRWEVIERFHNKIETLHADNPNAAIGAELKERLEVIQQESDSLGLLDRAKLISVFPEDERQKVDELYDQWEDIGATLFDAERIVDQEHRYSDMEFALGRLAKLNEEYLRMATQLFSEKSS
jgi:hypothetical protein